MDKWKNIPLSKEVEEGITAEVEEVYEEERFQQTLATKLWTDNSFNTRAFTNTMIAAWRLKNPVESHELSKNMFLSKFSMKRGLENVFRNATWIFGRNLLVLNWDTEEEQPSDLNMNFCEF